MNKRQKILKVLKCARSIIKNKEDWARHRYQSVDDAGHVRYCTIGACAKASSILFFWKDEAKDLQWYKYRIEATKLLGNTAQRMAAPKYTNLAQFNDYESHERIMQMFDFTIARLSLQDKLRAM